MNFIDLKKKILSEIALINPDFYQNPQIGAIFSTILLYAEGITQDQIMELTQIPRTIVSECLAELRANNVISCIKRPMERKNYYISKFKISVAIGLYLQRDLRHFEENTTFVGDILSQLQQFSLEEHKNSELQYFKKYLLLFQQQNDAVIQCFRSFLSNQQKPPKLDSIQQMKILTKIGIHMQKLLETDPNGLEILQEQEENSKVENESNASYPAIKPRLDQIKTQYMQQFMNLMAKTDKHTLYPAIVNLTYIELIPPSQDRYLTLLKIPRSTLSEAIKKVESDHLIKSVRFSKDGKLHYYPLVPRNLLLVAKFYQMIKKLMELVQKFRSYFSIITENLPESQALSIYLVEIIKEYEQILDFLFYLEIKLNEMFNLGLL